MGTTLRTAPRILVIEDDLALRDLMQELLEDSGYRVLTADHALSPVDVSQLRPDLVILDLTLHGPVGGWEFLQELRTTPGAFWIPVIVCTCDHGFAHREAERLEALAASVVLKPFDVNELLARIAASCGTRPDHPARRYLESQGTLEEATPLGP